MLSSEISRCSFDWCGGWVKAPHGLLAEMVPSLEHQPTLSLDQLFSGHLPHRGETLRVALDCGLDLQDGEGVPVNLVPLWFEPDTFTDSHLDHACGADLVDREWV